MHELKIFLISSPTFEYRKKHANTIYEIVSTEHEYISAENEKIHYNFQEGNLELNTQQREILFRIFVLRENGKGTVQEKLNQIQRE